MPGTTAAWWLGRFGFETTVVERAPERREGGQNIDVRGVGREVLRMRLEQATLAQTTGEEGAAWVNEESGVAAEFLTRDLEKDGPTAEQESCAATWRASSTSRRDSTRLSARRRYRADRRWR